MKIVLEIVLLMILIGGSFIGIKFGFVKIFAKPMKLIVSLFFAATVCTGVCQGIVAPMLQGPVTGYVTELIYPNAEKVNVGSISEELPAVLKLSCALFNVDLSHGSDLTADQVVENVAFKLTSPVVNIVALVISFFLLFFLAKILLALGFHVVNRFCDGGVLAKINKAMGFVLAAFLAVVAAWCFVCLTEFFFHLPIFNGVESIRNFDGGLLYGFFNSISPLRLLLSF